MGLHWKSRGGVVSGTFRNMSESLEQASLKFEKIYYCDLTKKVTIDRAAQNFIDDSFIWDVLVLCPGSMQPLGKFGDCDIDEWSRGVEANFTGPLRFLHKSMTVRNMQNTQPTVIFLLVVEQTHLPKTFHRIPPQKSLLSRPLSC